MRFENLTLKKLGFLIENAGGNNEFDVWGPTPGSHDYKNFPNDELWSIEFKN